MMNAQLTRFLLASYNEAVLGTAHGQARSIWRQNENDPTFIQAAKDEVKRINSLGLSSTNLQQRDFASYQHLTALTQALLGST